MTCKSLLLCFVVSLCVLLTGTNAFNVTTAAQNTCSGTKQLYRDMACCGGDPDLTATCVPKQLSSTSSLSNNTAVPLHAFCDALSPNSVVSMYTHHHRHDNGSGNVDLNAVLADVAANNTAAISHFGDFKPGLTRRHDYHNNNSDETTRSCTWHSRDWNENGTLTKFSLFTPPSAEVPFGFLSIRNVAQNTSTVHIVIDHNNASAAAAAVIVDTSQLMGQRRADVSVPGSPSPCNKLSEEIKLDTIGYKYAVSHIQSTLDPPVKPWLNSTCLNEIGTNNQPYWILKIHDSAGFDKNT